MKLFLAFLMMFVSWTLTRLNVIDNGVDQSAYQELSFACENAADAADNIVQPTSISDGYILFDQTNADLTFKKVLAQNLDLNETTLEPNQGSQFTSAPIIKIEQFLDYSNTTFPYHYVNSTYNIDLEVYGPSIIYVVQLASPKPFVGSPTFNMTWTTTAAYPDS